MIDVNQLQPWGTQSDTGGEGKGGLYKCSYCGRAFTSADKLDAHEQTAHAGGGTDTGGNDTGKTTPGYTCEVCGAQFLTPEALETHMQSAHMGQKEPPPTPPPTPTYEWEEPWKYPSWFNYPATYQIFQQSEVPSSRQSWFRSPAWERQVVWNPYYGWQDPEEIKGLYGAAKEPVTWEQFQGWGLPRNLSSNWSKYGVPFPPGPEDTTEPGPDVVPPATDVTSQQYWDTTDYSNQFFPNYEAITDYPYPPEWDIAGDVFSGFAQTGYPTQTPGQWDYGTQLAMQMGATGMPTSLDPWYQQATQQTKRSILDAIKEAAEQAGVAGIRKSTILGQQSADIAGKYMTELGTNYMQQQMAAQEAARQRQQEAVNQLYQYGTGAAGLTEAAKGRAMGAAGQLPNLGMMYATLPMNMSTASFNMGTQLQNIQQQQLNQMYQDWLRTLPENSPWLQYAMGVTQLPFQMTPQMYQQSPFSQLLSGASSVLPFLSWGQSGTGQTGGWV